MTAQAIQYYLCQDVVDGSAAAVSAANAAFWPSPANVPSYAYESLGTIWTGAATVSSVFRNDIVYRFGNVDETNTEISIFTQPIESANFDRVRANTIGAEETNVVIRLFKAQTRATNKNDGMDLIKNAELRIRYLLDSNWRRLRKGTAPFIPSTGDSSLDPSVGVYLVWDGFISPPSAVECHIRYRAYYVRAVPKAT